MDKEKIIVVLLIVTILLSVGSMIFTITVNTGGRTFNIVEPTRTDPDDTGSVQLIVQEPAGGAG